MRIRCGEVLGAAWVTNPLACHFLPRNSVTSKTRSFLSSSNAVARTGKHVIVMVETEVKLSWQKSKGKSMGLKVQHFSYGSLLSQFSEPATPRKLKRLPSPEDVEAPPLDSDDEIMQQPLIDDEQLEGSELDTPPTKPRDSRWTKPRVPRGGKMEHRSPGRGDEGSSFNVCEPSDIRTSSFGNSGKRRSIRHQKQEGPKREMEEEPAIQNEDDMGLDDFSSPQKRVKTTYSANIHGSAPAHLGKKSPKKSPPKATIKLPSGFTKPDMSLSKNPRPYRISSVDYRTVNELDHQKTASVPAFIAPPSVPETMPTCRMRRSPRKSQGSSQNDAPQPFMMPSFLPSPEKFTAKPSPKVKSLRSTDRKPPFTTSSAVPLPGQPGNDDLLGTEDLRKLVEGTKNKFKQPLGVQAPEPTSSIATSSIQSMLIDLSDSESSLSSPAALSELDASEEHLAFINSDIPKYIAPLVTRCPVCKEVVDQEFLDKFISGKRFRTLAQNRFHTAHKRQAAKANWQLNDYPEIDWKSIDERLSKFHDALENVIKGQTTSFYRNALEDRIKTGKHRTLTDVMTSSGIEGLSPGYYGSRGARVMYVDHQQAHYRKCTRC